MPDKGQELFDIMDAALKRQREGMDATLRRQGAQGSKSVDGQQQQRAAQPAVPAGEAAPAEPSLQPVRPVQPVQPVEPVQPVQPDEAAGPGSPQGQEGPADSSSMSRAYTERLSRVPDSARSAPPAGMLSPGEVLRGTVFTSRRQPQPGQAAEAPAAPAPVEGPPRPASVQASTSSVLQPQAPAAPPAPPPAAPPVVPGGMVTRGPAVQGARGISGPLSGSGGVPMSGPVAGVISGVRTAPPSVVQQPVSPSGRPAAPSVPASGRGFYVSVEMAVLAVIAMTLGLICAFYVGVRVGRQERDLAGPVQEGEGGKSAGNGEKEGDGIKESGVSSVAHLPVGDRPKKNPKTHPSPPTPPTGTGKYTIEVLRFPSNAKSTAEFWRKKLATGGIPGVYVIERKVRGHMEWCVCAGRFAQRNDPRAERLKQTIINFDRRRFTGLVEVIKLD